jgi:hypothetical protein
MRKVRYLIDKKFKIGKSLHGKNYEYGKRKINLKRVVWTISNLA